MDVQHHGSAETLEPGAECGRSKKEYARELNLCLGKREYKTAMKVVRSALDEFPGDPFFLSHFGFLTTAVENRARKGWRICEEAIKSIARSQSVDKDFFYPLMYLNLGCAYLAGNKKKKALEAFHNGLKYNPKHAELNERIVQLGIRKDPVLSFLPRGNPINKYLGRIRHKFSR